MPPTYADLIRASVTRHLNTIGDAVDHGTHISLLWSGARYTIKVQMDTTSQPGDHDATMRGVQQEPSTHATLSQVEGEASSQANESEEVMEQDQTHLTLAQAERLRALCENYGVEFHAADYKPGFDLPPGWVEGWVGGIVHAGTPGFPKTIFVGVSPEGDSHS